MKDKSFSKIKSNIAISGIITIFIGAIVYVPALNFSTKKETQVVYKNVPYPVFISVRPTENQNISETTSEDSVSLPEFDSVESPSGEQSTLAQPGLLTKDLKIGDTDPEVKILQEFLNQNGFVVAEFGAGSPGQETQFFGRGTKDALIRFQEANKATILSPFGLEFGTGVLGEATRNLINS